MVIESGRVFSRTGIENRQPFYRGDTHTFQMSFSSDRFTITGFGDEIAPDLETQLGVMESEDIRHIEFRSVGDTNVLDFTDEQLREVKCALDDRGFAVSAVGSPIGKVGITDDFEVHLKRFERALHVADILDTEYIRLFSYYIPEGDDPADHRNEVVRRMRTKTELATERGVTLLHENEKGIYGDTPERCRDILTAVDSPHLRAIFDPANFLEVGVKSYPDALLQVVEFVEYLHVKDAKLGQKGEIRPAGEGDGNVPAVVQTLADRGFTGFASLEPHLFHAGTMSGFSGPDGFVAAATALKEILADVEESER